MEQENINVDHLLEDEDVPELQISDEVPGATGYYWDSVNKQWIPIFEE
jgi:hypothetical protein